jgi:hypothetical protein
MMCCAGVQCDEREGRDGEVRVSLFRSQVGELVLRIRTWVLWLIPQSADPSPLYARECR